jgi:hypothetical protein
MSEPGTGWTGVLDAMERRLVLAERFLAGEEVHLDHFVLPDGLGPLPAELRPRARALFEATGQAESRLAVEMERMTRRVRPASLLAGGDDRPAPSYVDRSA